MHINNNYKKYIVYMIRKCYALFHKIYDKVLLTDNGCLNITWFGKPLNICLLKYDDLFTGYVTNFAQDKNTISNIIKREIPLFITIKHYYVGQINDFDNNIFWCFIDKNGNVRFYNKNNLAEYMSNNNGTFTPSYPITFTASNNE